MEKKILEENNDMRFTHSVSKAKSLPAYREWIPAYAGMTCPVLVLGCPEWELAEI